MQSFACAFKVIEGLESTILDKDVTIEKVPLKVRGKSEKCNLLY